MLIAQDTKNTTRNLELGGGWDRGDDGDHVIGIEELEEQVSAKDGRTHCGRPHEARSLLCKSLESPNRSTSYSFDFTNFQILEAPGMSTPP